MVGIFTSRGFTKVPQDAERLKVCNRGGCAWISTSFKFLVGRVDTTFSVVDGETDLPFLPLLDGAGKPSGQGVRGTRGLTAVLAGMRPDSVLCRDLAGVSLGLVSSLGVFAGRFRGRRSSRRVGIQVNTKYDSYAHIPYAFQQEDTGLPSLNLEKVDLDTTLA